MKGNSARPKTRLVSRVLAIAGLCMAPFPWAIYFLLIIYARDSEASVLLFGYALVYIGSPIIGIGIILSLIALMFRPVARRLVVAGILANLSLPVFLFFFALRWEAVLVTGFFGAFVSLVSVLAFGLAFALGRRGPRTRKCLYLCAVIFVGSALCSAIALAMPW